MGSAAQRASTYSTQQKEGNPTKIVDKKRKKSH